MPKGVEYGQSKKLEEFLRLQFILKVFEKQRRQNDPEAKEIWQKLSAIFKKLSPEEKIFLTMREKIDDPCGG